MKKATYLLTTVTISLFLTNCGGGGSSSTTTNNNIDNDTIIENQQDTATNNIPNINTKFTRVGETVIDNKRGLIWQDNNEVTFIFKSWQSEDNYYSCFKDTTSVKCLDTSGDTADTYCKNLVLDGYTNWRLPTRDELLTIVDKDNYPTIDKTFKNNQASFYWSSTPDNLIVNYALGVFFNVGNGGSYNKSDLGNIRCVTKK